MKVIAVIPSIGPGGLTNATLSRGSMFARANRESIIAVYEYNANFDGQRAEMVRSGRLDPRVRLVSPYQYYSHQFRFREGYRSVALITRPYTVHTAKSNRTYVETRFNANGERIATLHFNSKTLQIEKVEYTDDADVPYRVEEYSNGILVRITDYQGETVVSERYVSAKGFCFLRKEFNEDGRFARLWFWQPDTHQPKLYRRIWDWRRDFISHLAAETESKTLLLCDGNNVPAQFLRLVSDQIKPVAVIHMNHIMPNGDLRKPYATYFEKLAEFPATICLTERQAADLIDYSPEVSPVVIPNSIPSAGAGVTGRVKRNEAVIVTRLVDGKGLYDVMKAWALVIKQLPEAHLSIYGDGSQKEGLLKKAGDLGVVGQISFPGRTDEAAQRMAEAQLTLFASESEGFGLTIAESLSVGTPVVAMNCNYGPDEIIVAGKTGFVVDNRNVEEFSEKIIKLLSDHRLRDEMGAAGRQWATDNLSVGPIYERWETLIKSFN
ncbi:glycosyltransferase [Glutamicibacter arilaitensis]|uniref:glycosyltransferase n=1 Tax=Glutamicibacter arilaitensis TaxID=256701 RepID=UPI003FCF2C9F